MLRDLLASTISCLLPTLFTELINKGCKGIQFSVFGRS